MKFGIFYQIPCLAGQNAPDRYREVLYQIELAEDLGFDSVWLGELHFDAALGIMPSINIMAASIAQRTSRMRIGLGVSIIPMHDPLLNAEEAAMVDNLSDGRLEFGVGRGVLTFYDPFRIKPQESRERYAEALDIIVGAWTQDPFSYEGKHFQVREASLVPKPVQQPHPPLTVAASGSQGVFDVAAKRGMGVMAGLFLTPMETLKDRAATYRQVESDAGLPPKPEFMKILQPTFVSETVADAQEATRASVDQYFDALKINLDSPAGNRIIEAVPEYSHFKEARDEHSHAQIVKKGMDLYLTPDKTTERLNWFKSELPVGEMLHWFEMGGLVPHEKIVDSMKLFAKEVIPNFR